MHRTEPQTAAFVLTDSPVGLAAWIAQPPRSWLDRFVNVERVVAFPPRGDHFAPVEQPELDAHELRDVVRPFRGVVGGGRGRSPVGCPA